MTLLEVMEATRGDIAELRHEMRLGFARIDARFEQMNAIWGGRFEQMDAKWNGRFEQMDAKWNGRFEQADAKWEGRLEKGLREQTRFFFLAWSVVLASIIGLYAR